MQEYASEDIQMQEYLRDTVLGIMESMFEHNQPEVVAALFDLSSVVEQIPKKVQLLERLIDILDTHSCLQCSDK